MAHVSTAQQEEARASLLESVQPGDELYTILRHVSTSGMLRVIQIVKLVPDPDQAGHVCVWYLSWDAAELLGWTYDKRREGVRVTGCGMDMGFHVVESLARALFDDGRQLRQRWL